MPKKANPFQPRIYPKPYKGALVFYIKYWESPEGGKPKFHRTQDETCSCGKPRPNRPCPHLKIAQTVLADFEVKLGKKTGSVPLTTFFALWEQEAGRSRKDSTLVLYKGVIRLFTTFAGVRETASINADLLADFKAWLKRQKIETPVHSPESLALKRNIEYRLRSQGLTRKSPEYQTPEFQNLVAQMDAKMTKKEKPYSPAYIGICLRSLRAIFFWGVRKGFMTENPLSGMGKTREEKIITKAEETTNERNPLTAEERGRLLADLKGEHRDIAVVFLYTGMRLGELCNMRWDRITSDWFLRIEPTGDWSPKWGIKRKIKLHPKVVEVLERRKALATSEWVFGTKTGNRWSESNLSTQFRKIFLRLGIKGEDETGVSVHCFRHTLATEMLVHGLPPTTVRDFLGHRNLSTTMIYYHRLQNREAERIEAFDYA